AYRPRSGRVKEGAHRQERLGRAEGVSRGEPPGLAREDAATRGRVRHENGPRSRRPGARLRSQAPRGARGSGLGLTALGLLLGLLLRLELGLDALEDGGLLERAL